MLGFNVIVGVCRRDNIIFKREHVQLRDSGLGMLEKQNNEQMHKTQMVMFPWNHLDLKLQS